MTVLQTALSMAEAWNKIPQLRKIRYLGYMSFSCFSMFVLLFVYYTSSRIRTVTESKDNVVVFTSALSQNLQPIRYLAQRSDVHIVMIVVGVRTFPNLPNATYETIVNFIDALKNDGYSNDKLIITEESVQGEGTYGRVYDAARAAGVPVVDDASDQLDELLATNEVDFLVLGPCTHAAHFLRKKTDHRDHIRKITVGGGAFHVPGNANYMYSNVSNKTELNFYLDAEAANFIMLGSHGRPVTLLSLDASFAWSAAQYDALVTNPVKLCSDSSSVYRTVCMVANALMNYYTSIVPYPKKKRLVPLEMLAACYMADTAVQDYSHIMNTYIAVHYNSTSTEYGQSFHSTTNPYNFSVMVVMGIDDKKLWTTVKNAYALPIL